jgi:glutathionylspermidine synthase
MITAPAQSASLRPQLRASHEIDPVIFAGIRRRMILEFCKWDPQVEDVSVLAPFAVILDASSWKELRTTAELLARETCEIERRLLQRPDLYYRLGLPRSLRRAMNSASRWSSMPDSGRVMRFDFHPTCDGWRVSEVNSDVPGGFAEASEFPRMLAEHITGVTLPGNPGEAFAAAIARSTAGRDGVIALLSAAGFMEDQQVVAGLARRLASKRLGDVITQPNLLRWRDGRAYLAETTPVAAIVRFYQADWLANLPRKVGWKHLFDSGQTPVINPASAILTESKRLPLVWDDLRVAIPTWRRVLPETRDPREAHWRRDDAWLLKSAFCNTGDSITAPDLLPSRIWRRRKWEVSLSPYQWVAQRRFEPLPVHTPYGEMFPCLGVYTIDGIACGIYGRIASRRVIDYTARDVAVLVEDDAALNGEWP